MGVETSRMEEEFGEFVNAEGFRQTLTIFENFLKKLELNPSSQKEIYKKLKQVVKTKRKTPWSFLDKRAAHNVYRKGEICKNTKALVIGAGPCGLRMAIELALLGAHVRVVEARDYFARNNVLHLWPFVIQDLKNLGAKVFHPKFCTGNMDHVSIRRLQLVLLKMALILGVEVNAPVTFNGLTEPTTGRGWRASLSPSEHLWNNWEFDIIVGADGKRNALKEFKRIPMLKGKQAIAITANFVNHRTKDEGALEEIGGIFYVYQKEFFDSLKQKTGIDLENFVYYKDDTHYFVMTAKKKSLFIKGVLKQDISDLRKLLSKENINQQKLLDYAREAAMIATKNGIPVMEFAKNHHNEEDAAIFDFTTMYKAENSCLVTERQDRRLLQIIVGDTLIEPFWPTGAGCARGFLSVFDAAWMIRHWAEGTQLPIEVIAERENIYKLLSQASPDNLKKTVNQYTIDPVTRYGARVKTITVQPFQVKHLFDTDNPRALEDMLMKAKQHMQKSRPKSILKRASFATPSSEAKELLTWYRNQLTPYKDKVKISNLTSSWANGVALCAILHRFNSDFLEMEDISAATPKENLERAFMIIEAEFHVTCLMSVEDIASGKNIDKVEMFAFLGRLKQALVNFGYGLGTDQPDDGAGEEEESIFESLVDRLTSIGFIPAPLPSPPGSRMNSLQGANYLSSNDRNENVSRPSLAFCIRTPVPNRIVALQAEERKFSIPKKPSPPTRRSRQDESPSPEQPPPKPPRQHQPEPEHRPQVHDWKPHNASSGSASPMLHPSLAVLRSKGTVQSRLKAIRFTDQPDDVIPETSREQEEEKMEDNSEEAWGIPSKTAEAETVNRRVSDDASSEHVEKRLELTSVLGAGDSENAEYLGSHLDGLIARESSDDIKLAYAKQLCCLCHEKMLMKDRRRYLEDPDTGNSYYFHRKCFRCKSCRCVLRFGNVLPHKNSSGMISFYCFRHAPQKSHLSRYKSKKQVRAGQNELDWPDYAASTEFGLGPTSLAFYLRDNLEQVDEIATEADESLKAEEEKEEEIPMQTGDTSIEEEEEEEELDDLVRENQTYTSLKSIQLLVAHDLQLQVNDMEEMEEETEDAVAAAGWTHTGSASHDVIDEGSLNVMRISDQNSALKEDLSKRLNELEDRHRRLRQRIQTTTNSREIEQILSKLEEDTQRFEAAFQ